MDELENKAQSQMPFFRNQLYRIYGIFLKSRKSSNSGIICMVKKKKKSRRRKKGGGVHFTQVAIY